MFLSKHLNIHTKMIDGQRYTDEETRDVVQMVLAGLINKDIVRRINMHGGNALGVSGIDAKLMVATRYTKQDLGLVGEVASINASFIRSLLADGLLPVIAPLGVDDEGTVYNINADHAAGEIAAALSATKLIYLSDVAGIMRDDELLHCLDQRDAESLMRSGVIHGGMMPKVVSALKALRAGVSKVHLIDGRAPHALLLEIFTSEGIGTEIVHS